MSRFFGILLLVAGAASIFFPLVAGIAGILYISILLILGGVVEIIVGFKGRHPYGRRIFWKLLGLLTLITGVFCWIRPIESAFYAVFLLSCFFIVEGIMKLIAAFTILREQRGWLIFNAIISLLFGIYMLFLLKSSLAADMIIGVLIGVNLMFKGISILSAGSSDNINQPGPVNANV